MQIETNTVVACFDAEYTARNETDKGIQEMIQCALIICQVDENGLWRQIDEYVTFVKPMYVPKLSEFIIQFTNICQEDVDNAPLFTLVAEEIYQLIKKHKIDTVYVWGPDKPVLKYNMELTSYPIWKSRQILKKMCVLGRFSLGSFDSLRYCCVTKQGNGNERTVPNSIPKNGP